MKKTFLPFAILLIMAFSLVSCKMNTPKSVATTWLTAFIHRDFETAKKLSTEDTKKMMDMFEQLSQREPDSVKQQLKRIKVVIKDVQEDGDKATIKYVTSDDPNSPPEILRLVKQNGKWLAQYSKQDQMNEAGGNQPGGAPADVTPTDTSAPPPSNPATAPNAADTSMGK